MTDRIDISEEIGFKKINSLRECIHYWYFLKLKFRCKSNVCDGCHYLMQKALILNNTAIVAVKDKYDGIYFWCISKDEARNLLRHVDLIEKSGKLQNIITDYLIGCQKKKNQYTVT